MTLRAADGSEERIPTHTVVWAAAVIASELAPLLAHQAGLDVDRAGRVEVSEDLSLPDRGSRGRTTARHLTRWSQSSEDARTTARRPRDPHERLIQRAVAKETSGKPRPWASRRELLYSYPLARM